MKSTDRQKQMAKFFLCCLTLFLILGSYSLRVAAQTLSPLEEGVAITDPLVVRALEMSGWDLGSVLGDGRKPGDVVENSELKNLAPLAPFLTSLKGEFADYLKTHPGSGIGMKYSKRVFDSNYLSSPEARFVLVGVVNRMDRAYVNKESCGEIRFIYRLAYSTLVKPTAPQSLTTKGEVVTSRLPMTLNLVLAARPNEETTCAETAKQWLEFKKSVTENNPAQTAAALTAKGAVLDLAQRSAKRFLRLETNLQIVRWPAVVRPDFGGHAEYLLKVFRWDPAQKAFFESTLENQLDRDQLLQNPEKLARFKSWLTQSQNLVSLDQGTLLIPDEFLAKRAFSISPGGMARSANHPSLDFFSKSELDQILSNNRGVSYEHLKSGFGFQNRLDDISCSGCHQTRTVAGFHFMGRDPWGRYPGNSVFVSASPHFYADLQRRKKIVEAFSLSEEPDFSRSFAARPDPKVTPDLPSSGLVDGWGAHCSFSKDESFQSWNCASGLSCQSIYITKAEPGLCICLPVSGEQVGDPLERGMVLWNAFGDDKYQRLQSKKIADPIHYTSEPQSATPGALTGGFPGSMLHLKTCENLPEEASCGPLPGSKPGFNQCLARDKNFLNCVRKYSVDLGLRGCNITEPCRDDYICAEGRDPKRGVCVPPYFMFQFRVDGHPLSVN